MCSALKDPLSRCAICGRCLAIQATTTDTSLLAEVKKAIPNTPVFANTGVRPDTVQAQLSIADGAIVGTYFKEDGNTWNPVDVRRVREFMATVRAFRG